MSPGVSESTAPNCNRTINSTPASNAEMADYFHFPRLHGREEVQNSQEGDRKMKRVITAVLCAALTTTMLPAQELKVRANVPFAFHVCNRLLPEGKYEVENKSGALVVSDPNHHTSI